MPLPIHDMSLIVIASASALITPFMMFIGVAYVARAFWGWVLMKWSDEK